MAKSGGIGISAVVCIYVCMYVCIYACMYCMYFIRTTDIGIGLTVATEWRWLPPKAIRYKLKVNASVCSHVRYS